MRVEVAGGVGDGRWVEDVRSSLRPTNSNPRELSRRARVAFAACVLEQRSTRATSRRRPEKMERERDGERMVDGAGESEA